MDGEQTARAIMSDPALKGVKIIVLTSMGQRGDAVRLTALGCSAYLLKPVRQQVLFDAVIAVLTQKADPARRLVTRHVLSEQRRSGLRVLLAEDNPIGQKLVVVLLQKAGYSVDAVDTGRQAVDRVKSDSYNAILMDGQMPDLDGFEATREIRTWEAALGRHTPIIAMTAHAMPGDRERFLVAGMDDYLSKPLEPQALYNVLSRWVQSPAASANEAQPASERQDYTSMAGLASFSNDRLLGDAGLFGEESQQAREGSSGPEAGPPVAAYTEAVPFNLKAALRRYAGDREFILSLCQEFLASLPGRLATMQSALEANDANSLGRIAHNLKGIALNLSAEQIAELALQFETLAELEDLTKAPALLQDLRAAARSFQDHFESQAAPGSELS
jgi:CheY-like chemotaxis protein